MHYITVCYRGTIKTSSEVKNPDVVYWKKAVKNFAFISIVVRSSETTTDLWLITQACLFLMKQFEF